MKTATYTLRGAKLTHVFAEDEGIARRQLANIWDAADAGSVEITY